MPRFPPARRDGGTLFLGRYKIVQLIFPRRIIQSGYSPLKWLNCKQEETRSCFWVEFNLSYNQLKCWSLDWRSLASSHSKSSLLLANLPSDPSCSDTETGGRFEPRRKRLPAAKNDPSPSRWPQWTCFLRAAYCPHWRGSPVPQLPIWVCNISLSLSLSSDTDILIIIFLPIPELQDQG